MIGMVYMPTHAWFMRHNGHEWNVASQGTRDAMGVANSGIMRDTGHEWNVASCCTQDAIGLAKPGTDMGTL